MSWGARSGAGDRALATDRRTLRSRQRAFDRRFKRGEAGLHVAVEMHAQRAAAALDEDLEIAAGLAKLASVIERALQ